MERRSGSTEEMHMYPNPDANQEPPTRREEEGDAVKEVEQLKDQPENWRKINGISQKSIITLQTPREWEGELRRISALFCHRPSLVISFI